MLENIILLKEATYLLFQENKMNKKGSKIISVYWFVILVIIAGGIVAMVNVFYSSPYDVRVVESEILSMKIADCIVQGGKMNSLLISPKGVFKEEFRDTFLKKCKLNFDVAQDFEVPQYYAQVEFFHGTRATSPTFILSGGNNNWVKDCELDENDEKKLVKCSNREFFAQDDQKNIYLIKILSIVGNLEKNVK